MYYAPNDENNAKYIILCTPYKWIGTWTVIFLFNDVRFINYAYYVYRTHCTQCPLLAGNCNAYSSSYFEM